MTVSARAYQSKPARGRAADPVRQIIGGIDQRLSQNQGIKPFSDDPGCILRYALVHASTSFSLSDGASVNRGDLVVDVHCWNERVPPMPASGPDLAWAQDISKRLRQSLRLLTAELVQDPALRQVRACRARVSFVGRGGSNESVSRIIARMGFEDVAEGQRTTWTRLHDHLENLLLVALVWAHNPKALRRDKILREHRPVWASRERLLRRYGEAAGDAPQPVQGDPCLPTGRGDGGMVIAPVVL